MRHQAKGWDTGERTVIPEYYYRSDAFENDNATYRDVSRISRPFTRVERSQQTKNVHMVCMVQQLRRLIDVH